jgi:hypothetical protein
MTSKRPCLAHFNHSGRRPSASQANAQWDVSTLTGRPSIEDNRDADQVHNAGLTSSLQYAHNDDFISQAQLDKTESLLKRLQTDHFAGLVDVRYHAENMELPLTGNGPGCKKETKSCCTEH